MAVSRWNFRQYGLKPPISILVDHTLNILDIAENHPLLCTFDDVLIEAIHSIRTNSYYLIRFAWLEARKNEDCTGRANRAVEFWIWCSFLIMGHEWIVAC